LTPAGEERDRESRLPSCQRRRDPREEQRARRRRDVREDEFGCVRGRLDDNRQRRRGDRRRRACHYGLDEGAVGGDLVVDDRVGVIGGRPRDALDLHVAVPEGEAVRDEDAGDLRKASRRQRDVGERLCLWIRGVAREDGQTKRDVAVAQSASVYDGDVGAVDRVLAEAAEINGSGE